MMDRIKASTEARRSIILMDFLMFLSVYSCFYLLILFLIPRYLFKSKLRIFFLSFIAMVIFLYFAAHYLEHYLLKPYLPYNPQYFYNDLSIGTFIQTGLVICVLLGCVVGLTIFKKWINDVQRMHELHQTNLKTELEQLKSQVNPHFLFNTLNNLMVLTRTDPEKATQVLLGLSDLLRYQLYDSARDKILLSKDIAFLENLLALEKIRKNDFEYEINADKNLDHIMLPPFLFIPFVENAIKHGASTVGHSYLTLNFHVVGKELHFTSENSKPPVKKQTIGGLGLKNIKRRLELLYPESHQLETREDNDKYTAKLIIPI